MIRRNTVLIAIPLLLSAFTHLWNPVGFPPIHWDEHTYLIRAFYFTHGFYPQYGAEFYTPYEAPYLGWVILGTILQTFGYFSSIDSDSSPSASMFAMPRILMGTFAILDTFLIYRIAEKRYNSTVAFISSLLFAVMPFTWLLRRFLLEPIQLPFILGSILLALHVRNSTKSIESRNAYIAVLSGALLGIAIFVKIPAFTMIPVTAYFLTRKVSNHKLKFLALWFLPVLIVPALWPISAISVNQLDLFISGITWQSHRSIPENVGSYLQSAIITNLSVDPILLVLGTAGIIFTTIKKDYTFLWWIGPYMIFVLIAGWVSNFHFVILLPPLCIAAAELIYRSSQVLRKQKLRKMVLITSIIVVGSFGIVSTTLVISRDDAFAYYDALENIAGQVQDNNGIITLRDNQILHSEPLENNTNYIEATFRIKEFLYNQSTESHAGIMWNVGTDYYYAFLRHDTFNLLSALKGEFMHSPITLKDEDWHTLKIVLGDTTTNIYLNGSLMMQMPRSPNEDILKVGIGNRNAVAEFKPIIASQAGINPYTKGQVLNYNFLDFVDEKLGSTP